MIKEKVLPKNATKAWLYINGYDGHPNKVYRVGDKVISLKEIQRIDKQPNVWGELPRLANKIIDKNKINKETKENLIVNGGGVGSTDLLGVFS